MSETLVIAKNVTKDDIRIKDLLGITIDSTAEIELTPDKFHFYEVASSNDLKSYVYSGSIVINDGYEDLDIPNGIDHITLKGSRHIKEEIKDNSHYLDNHIDVPNKPTSDYHILEQQGDSTSFVWIKLNSRISNSREIHIAFNSVDQLGALVVKTTTYQEASTITFTGTSKLGNVQQIKIVASMENPNIYGSLKITNSETGEIYALFDETINSTTNQIYTLNGPFNFPSVETMLSMSCKTSNQGKGVCIRSLSFIFGEEE